MSKDRWYKLDNVAKIFPMTETKNDPKVFRFACELNYEVDKEVLQMALGLTIKDYPIFKSVLKKGFFWYYLEESDIEPLVSLEDKTPCSPLDPLLFRVMYFKKRISVEVNHTLTDGTGVLLFLRSLVSNYLSLKYDIHDVYIDDVSSIHSKSLDSFQKYYKSNSKIQKQKYKNATYKIKDVRYAKEDLKVIEGICNTKKVLSIAKSYNVTLTVYLTSVLIKSILMEMSLKERKKEIVIQVPVNLRKYFPSETVRNFFNVIVIKYKSHRESIDFDDIIKSVDKQFKENLKKENLSVRMNSYSIFENILLIRLIPRVIKDFFLSLAFDIASKHHTMTLSNLGIVSMPEEYHKYINLFDVFSSTADIQCCMCSYLDNLVISFTSHFVSANIEKNFFHELNINDVEIKINTNVLKDSEKDEEM